MSNRAFAPRRIQTFLIAESKDRKSILSFYSKQAFTARLKRCWQTRANKSGANSGDLKRERDYLLETAACETRKNFAFLGPILNIGGLIALGVIVASMVFGFTLGLVFSGIMIAFAAAAVLYSTSNIIHEYHTEQHVAASLSLFSSVGLLFWYILQFLMSLMGDD